MNPIFIIGMPASGKTTFGRALARRLGREFIDLDFCITQRFRASVAEIFARDGEEAFRRREAAMLREVGEMEDVVVACGGGGIPVIEQNHALKGASAVIEKDSIAGKLAGDLKVDELIILTSVPFVYRNFGKEDQTPVEHINIAEAKKLIAQGEFEEGTMLPKIEAAISYLEAVPEGSVLITSLSAVSDAIRGKSGTVITS